jgi:hypothetical protein
MMNDLLDLLLAGKTIDQVLKTSGKNLREVSSRSNFRSYRIVRDGAMSSTELYPEIIVPEHKKDVVGR